MRASLTRQAAAEQAEMLAQLLEEKQQWQTACRELGQDRDKVLKILAEQAEHRHEMFLQAEESARFTSEECTLLKQAQAEQYHRVRELETERDGRRHEIRQLNETVSRLRRECEAVQKAKLDSENEVSDWVTITRKRDEMVKALKEECIHLRVAEEDAQEERAGLQELLRQRDETICVLHDDCAHLRSAKVQTDTELKAAQLRYDTLECRGKELEEARAALKDRDNILEERDATIARLTEDRARIRSEKQAAQHELALFKAQGATADGALARAIEIETQQEALQEQAIHWEMQRKDAKMRALLTAQQAQTADLTAELALAQAELEVHRAQDSSWHAGYAKTVQDLKDSPVAVRKRTLRETAIATAPCGAELNNIAPGVWVLVCRGSSTPSIVPDKALFAEIARKAEHEVRAQLVQLPEVVLEFRVCGKQSP
jgi:chromosome segregation ATPase